MHQHHKVIERQLYVNKFNNNALSKSQLNSHLVKPIRLCMCIPAKQDACSDSMDEMYDGTQKLLGALFAHHLFQHLQNLYSFCRKYKWLAAPSVSSIIGIKLQEIIGSYQLPAEVSAVSRPRRANVLA